MDDLFNIDPRVSTLLATFLGIALMDDLTANEQAFLGNWFMQIGQTLETTGAAQMVIERRILGGGININDKCVKEKYHPVVYDIDKIRKIINDTMPQVNNVSYDIFEKVICRMQREIDSLKKT